MKLWYQCQEKLTSVAGDAASSSTSVFACKKTEKKQVSNKKNCIMTISQDEEDAYLV